MEKYAKVRVLGKGSFGSAILIRRRSDGALFVIKEVFLGKLNMKERTEARQECHMLQKLNHPNIVRYVEHFENRNNLYIVMEYCDDGDLHGKIKRSPMNETTILYYYSQVCLAMEYLHSRHILHRDIKTMNVFLMKNGSVKLGDFGIATVLRNTMGMASTVCGTPYYFSPEICKRRPYNNKSDVWALGVLLYELATGRHPFDGSSMQQLMQRIVKGAYNPLPPRFSRDFQKMVDWCLQKDPACRPSIKQMLALPIVRRSLERLEEDLMLATQCRIRLKDIIDYDAASEDVQQCKQAGQQIPGTPREEQRPHMEPRTPEVSPGKMAAMALAGLHFRQQQEQQHHHHHQQQQPQHEQECFARPPRASPRVVVPSCHAGADPADRALPLAPKPGASPAAAEHGRIELCRREAQPHGKRPLFDNKQVMPLSPYQKPQFQQSPYLPQYVPNPYRQLVQQQYPQLVEKHRLILQHEAGAQRQLRRSNEAKRDPGCGRNEGFEERIKRINAIVERYAKDVDPATLNTVHAYMKRKQEEYLRRQRERKEKQKRCKQRRKEELLRVIERQNRIARVDKVRKYGEQRHHAQRPPVEVKPPPQAQPMAAERNVILSPCKAVQSPPRGAPYLQQQNAAFGRDPRYVGAAAKEVNPAPGGRSNGHDAASPHCPNYQNGAHRDGMKGPAAAVDPFCVMDQQRLRHQPQQPGAQGRSDGGAHIRGAAASPRVVVYRDISNLNGNQRRTECLHQNAGQPDAKAPKDGWTVDPVALRRPVVVGARESHPLVVPTADQALQKQHALRRHLKQQQPLRDVGSEPCLRTPYAESPVKKPGANHQNAKKRRLTEEEPQPAVVKGLWGRRNSAPSASQGVEGEASKNQKLSDREVVVEKNHLRPTTAASFALESAPPGPQQAPRRSASSGCKDLPFPRVTSTRCRINIDDLPADAKVRRELQRQASQHIASSQLKGDHNGHPGGRGEVVFCRSKSCAPAFVNARSKGNSPILYRQQGLPPPSCPQGDHGKDQVVIAGDVNCRWSDPNQPAPLAPPQNGAGAVFQGLGRSPVAFSLPTSPSAALQAHKKQRYQRYVPNRSGQASQPCPLSEVVAAVSVSKINPAPHQPAFTRDKKPDAGCRPALQESVHTPVLVDVCYDVIPTTEDGLSKKVASDSGGTPALPSISDVSNEPPDVGQQWRNFVDKNTNAKAPYRFLCSQLGGLGFHNNTKLPGQADEMAVFQKVDGPCLSVPDTLEVLRGTGISSNRSRATSCSRSTSAARDGDKVGRERTADELPCLTRAPCITSPIMAVCTPEGVDLTRPSHLRQNSDAEEVGGFAGLEEDPTTSRGDDGADGEQGGSFSVQVPLEASLNGYLSMLDHLRDLLYNQRSGRKVADDGDGNAVATERRCPRSKPTKTGDPAGGSEDDIRDVVEPTDADQQASDMQLAPPSPSCLPTDSGEEDGDEESDEEDLAEIVMDDSDVEFGDPLPLGGPPCTGLGVVPYCCATESANFLPRIVGPKPGEGPNEGGSNAAGGNGAAVGEVV